MNCNYLIYFDFETNSAQKNSTQPLSLGAIAINPRTLNWNKNDQFYSLIKPAEEKIRQKLGLDETQDGALKVNKLKLEDLEKAPTLPVVWEKFTAFVNRYKNGSSVWGKPIAAGFNITNFDLPIVQRICGGEYNLGPKDKDGNASLFHPRDIFDLQKLLGMVSENFQDVNSQSMDSWRTFFGFPTDHGKSHHALVDCLEGSAILVRFLEHFRKTYNPNKLMGSMASFKVSEFL